MTEHSCAWKPARSVELQSLLAERNLKPFDLNENARMIGTMALIPSGVWGHNPNFLFDPAYVRYASVHGFLQHPAPLIRSTEAITGAPDTALVKVMAGAVDGLYTNILQVSEELEEDTRHMWGLPNRPKGLYIPHAAVQRSGLSYSSMSQMGILKRPTSVPSKSVWLLATDTEDLSGLIERQLLTFPGGAPMVQAVHATLPQNTRQLFERTQVKLATYEPPLAVEDILKKDL